LIGTSLSHYRITGRLGRGGMGEVYRATDANLGRDVAIKVLPEEVAGDPDRLARFRREAQLLAALDHPNVAHVYGLEEAAGKPFLVLELVEGEDLAERLRRGALPVDEAADVARQIAEALEEAHERGIVHRDLKPANVKLTPDGRVKVLDFGLAKALTDHLASGPAPDASQSPTLAAHGTQAGVILGTAAYMSPEQARGKAVDRRADIWAFGCVLFELLTGRPLFAADTVSDTLAAVLRSEPDWSSLPAGTPAALHALLRRCLTRDPRQRLRDIGDARVELERLRTADEPSAPSRPARLRRGLVAAAVALGLAGAGAAAARLAGKPSASVPSVTQLTFNRGTIDNARFGPGGAILYSARWRGAPPEAFSVQRGSPESLALGHRDARLAAVSRAGELALVLRPRLSTGLQVGTLGRAPAGGAAPRELAEKVVEADWLAHEDALVIARERPDEQGHGLELPAGRSVYVSRRGLASLRAHPRGDRVAACEGVFIDPQSTDVVVIDAGGKARVVASGLRCSGLAWDAAGRGLLVSEASIDGSSGLWRIDESGNRRLLHRFVGDVRLLDAGEQGLLVLHRRTASAIATLIPGAETERDLSWLDGSSAAALSRDGATLLFNELGRAGGTSGGFYLGRTDGSAPVRLGRGYAIDLSRDGRTVLARPLNDTSRLLLVPVGAGAAVELGTGGIETYWAWFFPDGRRILLNGMRPGKGWQFFTMERDGSGIREVTPDGFDHFFGQRPLSHDGRLIASYEPAAEVRRITIHSLAGDRPRLVDVEPDDVVLGWSGDDRGLLVYNRDSLPARLARLDIETGERRLIHELSPADRSGVTGIPTLVTTPDARAYAYNYTRVLDELFLIEGLE
jgi:hypothetical protein